MKHFRSSLTRLKTLIEQKLPEGKDIYGYSGIDKASLMSAIESAYVLSQEIREDDESRFEVISLIRSGSDLYKTLKDYLETECADTDKITRFNDFLNGLTALIEKTKITYYLVATHGIRNDEELAQVRARIIALSAIGDELKSQSDVVAKSISSIKSSVDGIIDNHKATSQHANEIKQWYDTLADQYNEIEETHNAIKGWDLEVQKGAAKYQALSAQISELAANAAQSRDAVPPVFWTGS